jgi:2-dehydro-3-deoxyglucarate aldolase
MTYTAFPNTFRRDVLAGKRLIGCWSSLANPITTEILGLAGFDWLLFDAEHSPNDVLTLIPQLMALKDSSSAPVLRPPANDAVILKRLLDAGFYNFLIPFVQSAEEARRAVAATLEDSRQDILRNSPSSVFDGDQDLLFLALNSQRDTTSLWSILISVVK